MHDGITIHGTSVHLYARPSDTTQFELRCKSQEAARTAAERIRIARTTKHFEADTPLYAAMLTWAWWGTGHLDADDSWPKYRGAMAALCELTGGTTLAGADRDWYSRVHEAMVKRGWTESKLKTFATTFGSFATWTTSSTLMWDGPRPGGTHLRPIHTSYRAKARSAAPNPDTPRIRTRDCPGLDDAIAFGDTLGHLAADRWGPDYACWGHAPRIQFVTGARLMELPTLRARSFTASASPSSAWSSSTCTGAPTTRRWRRTTPRRSTVGASREGRASPSTRGVRRSTSTRSRTRTCGVGRSCRRRGGPTSTAHTCGRA